MPAPATRSNTGCPATQVCSTEPRSATPSYGLIGCRWGSAPRHHVFGIRIEDTQVGAQPDGDAPPVGEPGQRRGTLRHPPAQVGQPETARSACVHTAAARAPAS